MKHSLIHNVVHNVHVCTCTYHSILCPITTKKRKDLTSNIRSEGVRVGGGGEDDEWEEGGGMREKERKR